MITTKVTRFPVFFPVSREFGAEKGSNETASSATQSSIIYIDNAVPLKWRTLAARGICAYKQSLD
jgi:hypothetical protein